MTKTDDKHVLSDMCAKMQKSRAIMQEVFG